MSENEMGVDAHVPSDTEAFDKKVAEMKAKGWTEDVTEEDKALHAAVQRFASFANFYLQNEQAGMGANHLLIQLFTNQAILQAEVAYLTEEITETDAKEIAKFKTRIREEMEQRLTELQVEHKIVITPQAVTVPQREGGIQVVKKEIPSAPIPEQED